MEMASIAEGERNFKFYPLHNSNSPHSTLTVFEDKAVADLVRDFVQGGEEEEADSTQGKQHKDKAQTHKQIMTEDKWDAKFEAMLKDLDKEYKTKQE